MVLFGATGDLANRLVVPALYNMVCSGALPTDFALIGVARRESGVDGWRKSLLGALKSMVGAPNSAFHTDRIDEAAWTRLCEIMTFVQGDLADPALYAADDGVIVSYAFQQEAHTHIVPGTPVVAGPRAGLALVVGLATDTRFFLYAVSDDPDTHEHSLVVFRGYYRTFLSGTPQRIATVPL